MDPETALDRMLRIANRIVKEGNRTAATMGGDLAETVLALDEWLAKGGFPPQRWSGMPKFLHDDVAKRYK